jgi:hypothetical protein
MKITHNQKYSILLDIQKQRYIEIDQMRSRAFQLITWIIGVFILLTGWIIQSTLVMTIS